LWAHNWAHIDLGGGLFIGNLITCVDYHDIKPHIYKKMIKKNKYIRTNNMLEIYSCIYTKLFRFEVTNASTTHKKYKS
jgi:hypothetical protein